MSKLKFSPKAYYALGFFDWLTTTEARQHLNQSASAWYAYSTRHQLNDRNFAVFWKGHWYYHRAAIQCVEIGNAAQTRENWDLLEQAIRKRVEGIEASNE